MTDQAKCQAAQTPESAHKVLQQTSVWAKWQFSSGKGQKKKKSASPSEAYHRGYAHSTEPGVFSIHFKM